MLVAVDYDKTFTAHRGLFLDFMVKCQDIGWDVCIVTYRNPELDYEEDFALLESWHNIKTYFTDGKAKKKFMEDQGIHVDIWIDDRPEAILEDLPLNEDALAEWRAARS